MAYQKVGGTPRFYIDQINYQKGIGSLEVIGEWDVEVSGLKYPSHFKKIDLPQTGGQYKTSNYSILNKDLKDINWVGIIGHTIGDELKWQIEGYNGTSSSGFNNKQGIINWEDGIVIKGFSIIENSSGDYFNFDEDVEYLRFTLMTSSGNSFLDDNITEVGIGSLCFGRYYDMPVSPDLDLSMEIEFDGVNNIKTLSGHTITQANYQGSPWWYDKDGNKVEPWSVGESTGISKRNGRRVWKLKFSYMSDKDLFASNYGSSLYGETGSLSGIGYDSLDIETFAESGTDIVTGGEFSSSSDWRAGEGWTFSGGKAVCGSHSGNSALAQDATFTEGVWYKIEFQISGYTAGSINPHIGGNAAGGVKGVEGTTTNITTYVSAGSNNEINMFADGQFRGSIDKLVIKAVNPSDFYYNIDNDDSFSAQVLNKISHGEKFIFQPDNTANNPSDFAICVLDGDSFDMKRVAPNVYDIEMKIREVW